MTSGYTRPNEKIVQHVNKSYKFAEGGKVSDDEPERDVLRKGMAKGGWMQRAWDAIPSPKDTARTGKISPSSEDIDAAVERERKKRGK